MGGITVRCALKRMNGIRGNRAMNEKQWVWFGNAGHLIVSKYCRFHLTTLVGKYLVSTVGQFWPERAVREIHAKVCDPKWFSENVHRLGDDFNFEYMKKFGYENIGYNRKFETMVFKAGKVCSDKSCNCGLPEIDGENIDFCSYQTAAEANKGHLKICNKWSKKNRED